MAHASSTGSFMRPRHQSTLLLLCGGAAIAVCAVFLWRESRTRRDAPPPALLRQIASIPTEAAHDTDFRAAGAAPWTHDPKATATVGRIRRMLGALDPVLPGEVEN